MAGCCGGEVKQPDYAASAQEGVYADLETLPFKRLIDAASKGGEKVTIGGKTYDFTSLGDADAAAANAKTMAQALLDIQKTYGADYVRQRVAELKLSDPEGQAARDQLFGKIQAQMATPSNRPAAEALEASTLAETLKGASLDGNQLREVQQGVRGAQAGRGNVLGNAAAAQEARAVGNAGEELRGQRQTAAVNYLTSGVTPEDVRYREIQQNLENLGSFINGASPTAQFSGLASAGNGAAPFYGGTAMTSATNANAGTQAAQRNLSVYQTQTNWQQQQANPYLAGAGAGLRAYGVYQAATGPK